MEREREGNEPEKEEIFSRAVGLNTVYQVDTNFGGLHSFYNHWTRTRGYGEQNYNWR